MYHLAATLTGLIYKSSFSDGKAFGVMPEAIIDDLSGWAGDLQTAMNDAKVIVGESNDAVEFKTVMTNLIGYDEASNDIYSGKNHSFDMDDLYADVDASNLFRLCKVNSINQALTQYFSTDYTKRFTSFVNKMSKGKFANKVENYTNTYFVFSVKWPLFDYTFISKQSDAARDAFVDRIFEKKDQE